MLDAGTPAAVNFLRMNAAIFPSSQLLPGMAIISVTNFSADFSLIAGVVIVAAIAGGLSNSFVSSESVKRRVAQAVYAEDVTQRSPRPQTK
jgi:hypothetical protein